MTRNSSTLCLLPLFISGARAPSAYGDETGASDEVDRPAAKWVGRDW
jgi:hypothetical protein